MIDEILSVLYDLFTSCLLAADTGKTVIYRPNLKIISISEFYNIYLSNSVSRDESLNPLAKGLLSIFSLVICKKRTGNML
jgi:hypothetical protein